MTRGRVFGVVVALTAALYLLVPGPAVGQDNVGWARSIVAQTPQQIWASSHFGQVVDYVVLTVLRALEPSASGFTAMRAVSFGMGLVYLAALAVLSTSVPRPARIPLFIVGAVSPISVFLHGEEEIPYYPFPLLVLVAALWRTMDAPARARWLSPLAGMAGIAAALHGVGLFFLPGVLALPVTARSVAGPVRDRVITLVGTALAFFGPTGALFILYVLVFPGVTIFPGDASGGGQQRLFVPLLGAIPEIGEFRAYSFFSLTHLGDVALLIVSGAPALVCLVAWTVARRTGIGAIVREDKALWVMAACGILFVTFYYAGVSVFVTASILIPALSIAQLVAALTLLSVDERPLWRSFPILAISSVAATVFVWTHTGTLSR